MPDFISRLADRSLGTAALVKPRTPSLFEHTAEYNAEPLLTETSASLPQKQPQPQIQAQSHKPNEYPVNVSATTKPITQPRAHEPIIPPQTRIPPKDVAPTEPETLNTRPRLQTLADEPRRISARETPPPAAIPARQEHSVFPQNQAPAITPGDTSPFAPEPPAVVPTPQPRTQIKSSDLPNRLASTVTTATPLQNRATPPPALLPDVTPPNVSSRPNSNDISQEPLENKSGHTARQGDSYTQPAALRRETEAVPPTVKVTIGRVDVRAVMPPTPPAQPRQPSVENRMVSLDDYLKGSNGGRR